MANYVCLVLCQHPNDTGYYLFRAPAWSTLNAGDDVIVKTRRGKTLASVVNSVSVEVDSPVYKMFIDVARAREPLAPVESRIMYHKFDYSEENKNE